MPPAPFSIAGAKPASALKGIVHSSDLFLRNDAVFVFLCGANKSATHHSPVRDVLLEYARKYFQGFRFFRAEEVFDALKETRKTDLLTLEDRIGDYSDCIIIVCESESAFAELGAFALSDKLVKQILVVNDERYRHSSSFITQGPIARANAKSNFKPAVYANFQAVLKSAVEIGSKLQRIQRSRRERIPLRTEHDFKNASPKSRLLFLADIVHFFCPITTTDMTDLLRLFYGAGYYRVHFELALLVSLGFVEKLEDDWLRYGLNEGAFFYDYAGIKPTSLRASIVREYFQNDRERLKRLRPQPK